MINARLDLTILGAMTLLIVVRGVDAGQNPPIRFADGTTVEIVGIAENSTAAAQWWAPDGSKAEKPALQSNASVSIGGGSGTKALQVVAKISAGTANGKNLVARIEPDFNQGLLTMRDTLAQTIQVFAPAPAEKPTFNLRLGLASGEATDQILWQRGGATTQPDDSPARVLGISEADGETLVQIKTDRPSRAGRVPNEAPPNRMLLNSGGGGGPGGRSGGGSGGQMRGGGTMRGGPQGGPAMGDLIFGASPRDQNISVISQGRKVQPSGFESSGGGTTIKFRCPIAQVEKVVLASRAYEWVEVRNISSQPAGTPTDVKVVPVPDPAASTPPVTEKAP